VRIQQTVEAALGQNHHRGYRCSQQFQSEGHRRALEVRPVQHQILIGEEMGLSAAWLSSISNIWRVHRKGRGRLDDLRTRPERIGVLHLLSRTSSSSEASVNFRTFAAHSWAPETPHQMDARIIAIMLAIERLQRHRQSDFLGASNRSAS